MMTKNRIRARLLDASHTGSVWYTHMSRKNLYAILKKYDHEIAGIGWHNDWNVDIVPKKGRGHKIKLFSTLKK